jgi:protein-tyrosine phosphatase
MSHYTLITPTVAIGDIYSSYKDFDLIVNLSNNAKAEIGKIYIENNIIHIGLIDRPDQKECCKKLIDEIIPYLLENKEKKILFHCNSGKSRSAIFAIIFLSYLLSKHPLEILKDIKFVKPNDGFIEILKEEIFIL